MNKRYLAIDLGAESGRAMLGLLDDGVLKLEELHRFSNNPVRILTGLHWDALRLFHEICHGLRIAGRERRLSLDGIGVDTWGVDFALLGVDGSLLANPRTYRDSRTSGMLDAVLKAVPRAEIFEQTGIQFMEINSLIQLYAMKSAGDPALAAARTLLMMPDLFSYWLTGVARAELTIASTSQFYNPTKKRWATELLEKLGLPSSMLAEIVPPGTLLGPLLPPLADTAGLGAVPVFTTGGHDTASAVAATPAEGRDWLYISSGTWSLMGAEIDEPVVNTRCMEMNLTNEIGAGGKVRLLKNIAGLWVLQECRRAWALEGSEFTYEELARMAAAAKPFAAIIDPDAFLDPGDMPKRIAKYCQSTGQRVSGGPAEISRVILESLALRYRTVLEMIESLLGRRFGVIHILGGGSQNQVLNQFVADATGRTVVAGPTEATAAGNVLIQAIGSGAIANLEEARAVVRRSFATRVVQPAADVDWDGAYDKYRKLVA
jgi:rhamnulokinase